MSRIVAAIFETKLKSDQVIAELRRAGFTPAEIDTFAVNAPGQHGLYPIGGDVHSDAGAQDAGKGAMKGALIGLAPGIALGLIASLSLGPESIALTTLLGALIGAFAGAMLKMRDPRRSEGTREHPVEPPAGEMVAVNVDRPGTEDAALRMVKTHGARYVGRTNGEWRDGAWKNFDPRTPLAPA